QFRSPIHGCGFGGAPLVMISYCRAVFVEAFRTSEQMSAYLIAGHWDSARRLDHAGRGTTHTPLIWKADRKMPLGDQDQLFRIGQIPRHERSICSLRRLVHVGLGVAIHRHFFSKHFPLSSCRGNKTAKGAHPRKKKLTRSAMVSWRRPGQKWSLRSSF